MTDYSLYVITDKTLAGPRGLESAVAAALAGGATIIQYREKSAATGVMIEEAKKLHVLTRRAGVPLIINDRVDVFLAVGAEGVHVGQDDMPAALARKLIGTGATLGVSVKTVVQALRAVRDGADYLGVGDIFGTSSKPDAGVPIGLRALKEIAGAVSIPVVGIGAVNKTNAAQVIASGADGVAVISAVIGAQNPTEESRHLLQIVKETF